MSLSPSLFNILLEKIMSGALVENLVQVSIGGRNTCITVPVCVADDIYTLADEKAGLKDLLGRLDKICTMNKMKINAEKS